MGKRTDKEPTDIGRFILKVCRKNDMIQNDMAKQLGVTHPFLSRVIYGEKRIPAEWFYKISQIGKLSVKQKEELDRLIFFNRNRKTMDLSMFDEDEIEDILNYAYDVYACIKK